MIEPGAQAMRFLAGVLVGPDVHEEQARLVIEHVVVDGGHLDPDLGLLPPFPHRVGSWTAGRL